MSNSRSSIGRYSVVNREYKKSCWLLLKSSAAADELDDDFYRLLDADLRPLTPDNTCQLSRDIFEEHKLLAQEYLKVQTEIALVGEYRSEVLRNLDASELSEYEELRKLEDEKESLVKLYRNLKRQLEIMRNPRRPEPIDGATVPANAAISGDDGWVVVPRQEPSRIS